MAVVAGRLMATCCDPQHTLKQWEWPGLMPCPDVHGVLTVLPFPSPLAAIRGQGRPSHYVLL